MDKKRKIEKLEMFIGCGFCGKTIKEGETFYKSKAGTTYIFLCENCNKKIYLPSPKIKQTNFDKI